MSRIGRMPVAVPAGVTVTLDGNVITVKGPKGELTRALNSEMIVNMEGNEILVSRPTDDKEHRALHGLTRVLIHNMVIGVTEGYSKELEIVGVGYRASMNGKQLVLNLGYSHPVNVDAPAGIAFEVPQTNKIVIKGIDKQLVGQITADIRAKRPPEPYLGKGVKYVGEKIRRKSGKAGKK